MPDALVMSTPSLPLTVTYDNTATWLVNADVSWRTWATSSTTATLTINNLWTSWNTSAATTSTTLRFNVVPQFVDPQRDAERRQARELADERRRIEVQARMDVIKEAGDRASETLRLLLDDQQWDSWQRDLNFELLTQSGRRYRVRRGHAGNVRLIEQGVEVESLCCHPEMLTNHGRLPNEDAVIAQVLALRTDEESFRRTANIQRMRAA